MNIPKYIGRYEILDELGHGAMGSVFRARDPAIDRVVAVKTILAAALNGGQDEEARQRFYREARAAGALAHPGIVPIFDIGEHEGVPFFVMEFVDGQTLYQVMKRGERMSLDRACEIGQRIAEALGYAHRNGVIHRDIKPANILMTSRQTYGEERPKITDFGVAKLSSGQLTLTGQFLGTPAFMPPEQFTGEPIDGRTDLFSLGVILYWMATGEQPFLGESMTSVSYKVVHTEPLPPAKLNPAIPPALEAVILKSLAKSPSSRYQSGEELAQALADLRIAPGAVLSRAVPLAAVPMSESQDTLDAMHVPPSHAFHSQAFPSHAFPLKSVGLPTSTPAAPDNLDPQAKVQRKPSALVLSLVGLVAISAVAGGGYLVVRKKQASPSTPQPVQAVSSQQATKPSPAVAADGATTALSDRPAVGLPNPAPTSQGDPSGSTSNPTAALNTTGKPAAKQAVHPMPAVFFDPKKLDPKKNTRLKFDFSHFPADTAVSVEMDGKVFFHGSAGSKPDYDNLYAPPGVHELRVTVGGSHVQKASNIVSAEFIAKKHMTLKLELRPQPKDGVSGSQLAPSTQVIATLKSDHFF
jgi:serine/threonine protein kinase